MEFRSDILKKKMEEICRARVGRKPPQPTRRTLNFDNPPSNFYGSAKSTRSRNDAKGGGNQPAIHSRTRQSRPIRDSIQDYYWQPGETLPLNSYSGEDYADCSPTSEVYVPDTPQPHTSQETTSEALLNMSKSLTETMKEHFKEVGSQIEKLGTRIEALEEKQTILEKKCSSNEAESSPVQSSSSNKITPKRRRINPVVLQSKIRRLHNAFGEDNKLRIDEPITSPHNVQVVSDITKSVNASRGDKYSEEQVQRGCKTYRKTLVGKSKHVSTPVKFKKQIRSRKQRIFERRAKQVKPSEAVYWKDITADMMSEEEKEDSAFVRHPPSYRSNNFNKFLKKLDDRYEKQTKSSNQPRLPRQIGSPREKAIPTHAKKWLVKPELRARSGGEDEADISIAAEDTDSDGNADTDPQ